MQTAHIQGLWKDLSNYGHQSVTDIYRQKIYMHDKYTIQKHKLGNFESKSFTTKLCGILAQLGPTWTSGTLGVDILTPDSIRMWHVWPIRAIGINSMVSTTVLVQQG